MIAQGRGKIINIASIAGRGQSTLVAYCASKGGVIQLPEHWPSSGALQHPGECDWPGCLLHKPMAAVLDDGTLGPEEKKIPQGREGRPEELGPLVVYLASAASDFMTGRRASSTVRHWQTLRVSIEDINSLK